MTPSSGQNSVLQLNMGEGKSSVIVPIISASLADSKSLVRIVVLKPLAKQMFDLLLQRLCGLSNRRLFYMPFSRDVKMGSNELQLFQTLYEQCLREGGILIAQPEHILSFKLMEVDRQLSSKIPELQRFAREIRTFQTWLNEVARDILDESDEILHVRYQLVYTVGVQRPLEDHPNRWTTIQRLFSFIEECVDDLHQNFPTQMEIVRDPSAVGSFPLIRILGPDAAEFIHSTLADIIIARGLFCMVFTLLPRHVREAIRRFITKKDIHAEDNDLVRDHCKGGGLWQGILLLRGLLAHGVLIYVLKQKRWRVDYGLDPDRSMLSVPYRAKVRIDVFTIPILERTLNIPTGHSESQSRIWPS